MTKTPDNREDAGLGAYFAAARDAPPLPPASLLDRVAEDALRHAPRPGASAPGWAAQLRAALGGWPGMAGLAAASVAGLWIGLAAAPALMPLDGSTTVQVLDPFSAYDLAALED